MTPAPGRDDTTGAPLADAHARYHDQPGNLMPEDADCGWEGCMFVTVGRFLAALAPAATPGRDELRQQIAAALCAKMQDGRRWRDMYALGLADAAASVVDTWMAAHTAEVVARVRALQPFLNAQGHEVLFATDVHAALDAATGGQ